MASQKEALMAKGVMHEPPDIVGDVALIIPSSRARRIAEPPHVGRDNRKMFGQCRHNPAPFPPGLWPTMEKANCLWAIPDCHIMQPDIANLCGMVFEHEILQGG